MSESWGLGNLTNLVKRFAGDDNKRSDKNSIPFVTSASSKVTLIEDEFDKALEQRYPERLNEEADWRLYTGFQYGQWDADALAILKEQNRNPFQCNLVRGKVDGLQGSVIKSWFDISFESIDPRYDDLTKVLKQMLLSDKELMDWEASYLELVKHGLIYQGLEELYVSDRYSPLGNLGFRTILPGHYILDPNWVTNDSRDLKRLWRTSYMTVTDISQKYNIKEADIMAMVRLEAAVSSDYESGDTSKGLLRFEQDTEYGDLYRVIEYHHMEKEKSKVRININDGSIIPETDEEFLQQWAELNGVDLDNDVIEREVYENVYYVTTICPQISKTKTLQDKKGYLQIGRLPFFHWSAFRNNGVNSGVPELLRSLQQTYNKRESQVDFMISASANGAAFIDPEIVDNDPVRMERAIKNWSNPAYRDWSAPGRLASGRQYVQELPKTQMDYGIVNELNRMVDMTDMVSKHSAASDARTESSDESGILFARKQLQSEINQAALLKSLEFYWNQKGEAYLMAAKQVYGGVYREFIIPSEGRVVEVNKPIITPEGEMTINDITLLDRAKVVVDKSPLSTTMRAVERSINTELLRVIGPDNPITRAEAVKNIMKTLEGTSAERARREEHAMIELELAKQRALTDIMNSKFTQMQIQTGMQQMMMPQMAGMIAQGGEQQQAPQPAGNPAADLEQSNAQITQS